MKIIYLLSSIFFTCVSCQVNTKGTNGMNQADSLRRAQAIEIKIQAMNTFYHTGGLDSLDFILSQLDKSMQIDSMLTQTYKDKSLVLASEKDYAKAIKVLQVGFKKNPSDFQFPEVIGFFYQKQGDTIQANQYYREAIRVCNEQITLYPDSAYFPREKAVIIGFLYNSKDSLFNELKRLQIRFPKDISISLFLEAFNNNENILQEILSNIANYEFIKKEYLKSLTPEQRERILAHKNNH